VVEEGFIREEQEEGVSEGTQIAEREIGAIH